MMATTLAGHPGTVYRASEGDKFSADTTLEVVTCATCAICYAIPESLQRAALAYRGDTANGWKLCCPLGHTWWYVGETELAREQRLRGIANDRAGRLASQLDQSKASLRGERAAKTRIKNERDRIRTRVAAGVCPCCNRTFKQLAAHMKAKHPEYAESIGS
jgi:hypothetical protein